MISVVLFSCKKKDEDDNTTTGGGSPTATTPTDITVSLIMNGTTYSCAFGTVGSTLQFTSETMSLGFDSLTLYPSTSLSTITLGSGITFTSITMPTVKLSQAEWDADPGQAFIDYFNDAHESAGFNQGALFFILTDGTSWETTTSDITGDWIINKAVEQTTYPALVRCQGQVHTFLTNPSNGDTHEATIDYVLKFQEPF